MNMLGLVPGFVAPTMFACVPMGMALSIFVFYHSAGIKANGFGYIKQFLGPMLVADAAVISRSKSSATAARPLSLTFVFCQHVRR